MPGFIAVVGSNDLKFNQEERTKLIQSSLNGEGYRVERRTVAKFMSDKVFVDRPEFLIVTEGVILNRVALQQQFNAPNFEECIVSMYKKHGETFFNFFRGSFSGVLFDKATDTWIIYTDHIGDKQVFYSIVNNGILFGSEMGFLVETLKSNNYPISISKTGAYLALTHGFVIEDHTLVTEVKKLTAGHYLRYDKQELKEVQYHRFTNKPKVDMTIDEAIEGIDKYFRKAVQLQFEKDKEYDYKHLTTLSGGLDSRMTVWVAHQMGYTDQLNTTFSQSNYLDFSIAQQIATDLHHDFLFKTLDHGDFIRDIDVVTKLTYGNAMFFGLAHGKSLYDKLNFEPYGIVHTGMIGDAIIGTFFKKLEYNKEVKIGQGAYSLELIEKLKEYKFKYEYENEEIFCLYTRAFTGANQGMVAFQEHTESCSPFCDVDFIEFCYSIPLNLRFNHKIYFDWILQKYPGAAEYIWEKKRTKIHAIENTIPKYMTLFGKKIPALTDANFTKWLKGSILRRLGLRKKGQQTNKNAHLSQDNMNPVDYWMEDNPKLHDFIANYFRFGIDKMTDNELKVDCIELFNSKNVSIKLQVLSLLSAINAIKLN